ncbi:permease [Psychromonas sp. KJ10-10]|uniref:permease n=1 Tax=Psychromonas sp. KJ10-10 TaxID=3391823 RepID=UPI0039B42B64
MGAITPFCSCSTIPMLIGLLKAKAGFGPTMTFLFTSPLLNPIIIALFIPVLGFKATLLYAAFALTASVIAGILLQHFGFERYIKKEMIQTKVTKSNNASENKQQTACCDASEKSQTECCDASEKSQTECRDTSEKAQTECCDASEKTQSECCDASEKTQTECCDASEKTQTECCDTSEKTQTECCDASEKTQTECCSSTEKQTPSIWKKAWSESWSLFLSMFPYMLIAMLIGAFVHGFVPAEFFADVAGADNPMAVPTAALIGIPLYIRVTALLPLVASFLAKGVSIGAIIALVIGSGGASLPEVILLKRLFYWPLLLAFLMVIFSMAVIGGFTFNLYQFH